MTCSSDCQHAQDNLNLNSIVVTMKASGFQERGSRITSRDFIRLLSKYEIKSISEEMDSVEVIFDHKQGAIEALNDIKSHDYGLDLTVSGIADQDYAVGIRGKLSKLPEQEILEITTMCGHGMISQHLTRQILLDIKRGKRTSEEAANYLATPCMCGVFNQKRAQRLLEELTEIWCFDEF